MKAMAIVRLGPVDGRSDPLAATDRPAPEPREGEALLRVTACGVCHTELDEIEGRTPPPRLPVIPGHQVVGRVAGRGRGVTSLKEGDRVGVGWIHSACGRCPACLSGRENLCPDFRATGRDADGGYAEFMTAPAAFVVPVPAALPDLEAAPLLCAGAVGWRALRLAGLADGQTLGLTGFGASGHLVLKAARFRWPGLRVHVFARSAEERAFARELGAAWTGDTEDAPPEPLDAIIDTTPAWKPVLAALRALAPGGRLIVNAIRKEDGDKDAWRSLDYPTHLWMEKSLQSVANVTRRDMAEFLALAAEAGLRPDIEVYPFAKANEALRDLKARRLRGAKVLKI
ncbi:MAG: zinc-dependent alcohol dehydrogenase family protein [Candidatus Aminicenantes bacterium]|nr:zinc-dependent alcohol dehydrogenase family protein [Candidatus Aminicenantes bacterium]